MNHCKTCKHWTPRGEYEAGHHEGLGRCGAAPLLYDVTEWDDDGDKRVLVAEHRTTLAFVQDASDYVAYLLTRPEFGCVSHQADAAAPAQGGETAR